MEKKYNTRSPAVKRLMREAAELSCPTSEFSASPLEDNLFEWHFTVRGPGDTDFQGGIYHGRIIVPAEYPMKPPDIIVLTPNGRFEVGKKICLSISGHHPETWQPSWSIRTALLAIIGFMPTPALGTIGSLDYSPEERKRLARRSVEWSCPLCGVAGGLLLPAGQDGELQTREEVKKVMEAVECKSEEEVAQQKKGSKEDKKGTNEDKKGTNEDKKGTKEDMELTKQEKSSEEASGPSNEAVPGPETEQIVPTDTSSQHSNRQHTATFTDAGQLPDETSRGMQVSDILIMLLVAAIGAILFRRINLLQESEGEHSLLEED